MSRPFFLNCLKFGVLSGLFAVLGACARPPEQEMSAAESALAAAAQAGADEFAADQLSMAQETFADAKAKMQSQDYKGARAAALEVKAKAEAAAASVESNKAAARTESEQRMAALKAEIDEFQPRVSSAKGSAAAPLKAGTAALQSAWAGVQSDYDTGHYNRAIDKMDEMQAKLDELKTALDAAKKK